MFYDFDWTTATFNRDAEPHLPPTRRNRPYVTTAFVATELELHLAVQYGFTLVLNGPEVVDIITASERGVVTITVRLEPLAVATGSKAIDLTALRQNIFDLVFTPGHDSIWVVPSWVETDSLPAVTFRSDYGHLLDDDD